MQAEIRKGEGNELRKRGYREGRRVRSTDGSQNDFTEIEGLVKNASPESKTLACMT